MAGMNNRLVWHFYNEMRLQLFMAVRYWFESLFGLALVTILFTGLLVAISVVGDSDISSGKLDGLIVGFALWIFATAAYSSSSHDIADETRARTIEQICVAPISLATVLGIRACIRLLRGAFALGLILLAIEMVTEGRLNLKYYPILLLSLLAAPGLAGLGYLMAGLILLVKRAETAQALMYPALIALVALPAYPLNMLSALPYALGAAAARASSAGQVIAISTYFSVLGISLIWLFGGILSFRGFVKIAKSKGLIGHL